MLRAEHKLQKKGKKEKLRRLARGPAELEGIGGNLICGRKGGLMPAALQVQTLPEFLPSAEGLSGRHGAGIMMGGHHASRASTTSGRPDR